MNPERIVRIVAGTFVLVSLALGVEASPLFVSPYLLLFTAFVGANLLQSGFTRFCPLEIVLRRAGVGEASAREATPCSSDHPARRRATPEVQGEGRRPGAGSAR